MKIIGLLLMLTYSGSTLANKVRFLLHDHDALQARVDLIQQAKNEILVEYFSVWKDAQSIGAMALILEAAKRGVKVKIIVDYLSSKVGGETVEALNVLTQASLGNELIEIKYYNPLGWNLMKMTHRDHAKMIIADGKRMITGGRNIGDKYFGVNKVTNYVDLDLLLEGDVVTKARKNFYDVWKSPTVADANVKAGRLDKCLNYMMSGMLFIPCYFKTARERKAIRKEILKIQEVYEEMKTVEADDLIRLGTNYDWFKDAEFVAFADFVSHGTQALVTHETAHLNMALLKHIGSAKKNVQILTPYLAPTANFLALLDELKRRKVRVRIVSNSLLSTDNPLAFAGYLELKQELVRRGVELYEFKGVDTLHAKVVKVDDDTIIIGTYNLDPRSAFINREIGVVIKDRPNSNIMNELDSIMANFRKNSFLVGHDLKSYANPEDKKVPFATKAKLFGSKRLLPLLRNQI